jgi:hypothetical protein
MTAALAIYITNARQIAIRGDGTLDQQGSSREPVL